MYLTSLLANLSAGVEKVGHFLDFFVVVACIQRMSVISELAFLAHSFVVWGGGFQQ